MKLDWYEITAGEKNRLPDDRKLRVERLQEGLDKNWLKEITREDYVCKHDSIQYRAKTQDKVYAYMCSHCYDDIIAGKDHNEMGFSSITSIKLREYLEKII